MFYFLIRWCSLIFLKLYLWLRIDGAKNIPEKGPFILAANHSSYLDPLILAASIDRPLHFVMRDKLLAFPLLGWILKRSNTIPVKRHGRDMAAVKKALGVLKDGRVLAIFPEGTRTKDRKLKRAKTGIGMFVYKAKAPVVPAYIEGAFDAMPRRVKTLKRHPVRLYIGKSINFKKECAMEQGKDAYQRIADGIMDHIAELKSSKGVRP